MSPRTSQPRTTPYASAVRAVERALAALEHLAHSDGGLTLAELSRTLRVSASSTSAILRTLEHQGYLSQDPASRRYTVSLSLVALGRLAAGGGLPEETFSRVARPLANELGETISLWALHGAEAVFVAAEEGPKQMRFAPRPGLRWPAAAFAVGHALLAGLNAGELADWHSHVLLHNESRPLPPLTDLAERCSHVHTQGYADEQDGLESGLYVLAVPVAATWRGSTLAIAFAGHGPAPAQVKATRIAGALHEVADAVAVVAGEHAPRIAGYQTSARVADTGRRPPVWLATSAGPLTATEVREFLNEPWLATLACLKENGYPYTVPVWYEWDGDAIWVTAHARAEWAAHLRRNPQVSLTISESEPPLRRVLIEGHAEVAEAPGGQRAHEAQRRLAERYLGSEAAAYGHSLAALPRWLFRILPEKMLSWRGLSPHPRYSQADPPEASRQKAVGRRR